MLVVVSFCALAEHRVLASLGLDLFHKTCGRSSAAMTRNGLSVTGETLMPLGHGKGYPSALKPIYVWFDHPLEVSESRKARDETWRVWTRIRYAPGDKRATRAIQSVELE